jgi:hypothetical protein
MMMGGRLVWLVWLAAEMETVKVAPAAAQEAVKPKAGPPGWLPA